MHHLSGLRASGTEQTEAEALKTAGPRGSSHAESSNVLGPLDKHAAHTFPKSRKSHPTNRDIFKFKQRVKVKETVLSKRTILFS